MTKISAQEYNALPESPLKSKFQVQADGTYLLQDPAAQPPVAPAPDPNVAALVEQNKQLLAALAEKKEEPAAQPPEQKQEQAPAVSENDLAGLLGKGANAAAVAELLNKKVSEQTSGLQSQMTEIQNTLKTEKQKAQEAALVQGMSTALLQNNMVRKEAHADIINRARADGFVLTDGGALVINDGPGGVARMHKDQTRQYGFNDWVGELREKSPYFFHTNTGGNASGANGHNGGTGDLGSDKSKYLRRSDKNWRINPDLTKKVRTGELKVLEDAEYDQKFGNESAVV